MITSLCYSISQPWKRMQKIFLCCFSMFPQYCKKENTTLNIARISLFLSSYEGKQTSFHIPAVLPVFCSVKFMARWHFTINQKGKHAAAHPEALRVTRLLGGTQHSHCFASLVTWFSQLHFMGCFCIPVQLSILSHFCLLSYDLKVSWQYLNKKEDCISASALQIWDSTQLSY